MRGLYAFLAAIAGLVAGYVAGFAILYPFFTQVMGYHDMDGGIAMGVAFGFAPLVAVVCAIAAAVVVFRKAGGPRQRRAAGEELEGGAEN
ncbi:hypothetical protein [Oricola nitratireducens]|uniref:hypothetical protein n=1 Tax=Oricola nitratireducens TaxID=2775868 RepID=UPI001868ADF8|nr:hypothetical protein [Oricola nitratireducens]